MRKLSRAFDTNLSLRDAEGDEGRIVTGSIIPFGEVAEICEVQDGKVVRYLEEFLPECTLANRQLAQRKLQGIPSWIALNLDHDEGFDREVGRCRSLAEDEAGVQSTFRLYGGHDLPKVRSMLTESHGGLSVQFGDLAAPIVEDRDGLPLVRHRQVNVFHVAATPIPAYAGAGITEMRDEDLEALASERPNIEAVEKLLAELRR